MSNSLHQQAVQSTADKGLGNFYGSSDDLTKSSLDMFGPVGFAAFGTAALLIFGLKSCIHPRWAAISAFIWGFGIFAVWWFFIAQRQVIKHFFNGIQVENEDGVTTILWDELESFQSSWKHLYHSGIYASTQIQLVFRDCHGTTIRHDSAVNSLEKKYKDLEAIQDAASRMLAAGMLATFKREGRVRWTEEMVVVSDGLEYSHPDSVEPVFIPLEWISDFIMGDDELKIFVAGDWDAAIRMDAKLENFHPGMIMIRILLEESGQWIMNGREAVEGALAGQNSNSRQGVFK